MTIVGWVASLLVVEGVPETDMMTVEDSMGLCNGVSKGVDAAVDGG